MGESVEKEVLQGWNLTIWSLVFIRKWCRGSAPVSIPLGMQVKKAVWIRLPPGYPPPPAASLQAPHPPLLPSPTSRPPPPRLQLPATATPSHLPLLTCLQAPCLHCSSPRPTPAISLAVAGQWWRGFRWGEGWGGGDKGFALKSPTIDIPLVWLQVMLVSLLASQ